MTQISQIRLGQRVRFFRSHDKQHALTGKVVGVQKNGSMVRIQTDEANGSVSRLEEAHCDDVSFVGSGPAASSVGQAEWDENKPKEPVEPQEPAS